VTHYCLIPATRTSASKAADSALALGWTPLVMEDTQCRGANWARNRLFEQALSLGAQWVRYCDDDDLVVGLEPTPFKGLVYFDYLYQRPPGPPSHVQLPSTPREAFSRFSPWCWAASSATLLRVVEQFGSLWDESIPCRQGGWQLARFIKSGTPMYHTSLIGYHWIHNGDGLCNHPQKQELSAQLDSWVTCNLDPQAL
jgi:hypothetical protein